MQKLAGGDEQGNGRPRDRRGDRRRAGKKEQKRSKTDVSDRDAVVLGSGDLGLVYLMEERRRLMLEEIEDRHPRLIQALRDHPHVGWVLVRSSAHGAMALGRSGINYLSEDGWRGMTRSRPSRRTRRDHLLRTDGFSNVADIMVGSFYDPIWTKAAPSRS